MEKEVKQIFRSLGAELCGIASVARFSGAPEGFRPTDLLEPCQSVIVFAKPGPVGLSHVSPRMMYHHFNYLILHLLDGIAYHGALELEKLGGIAVPLPSDSPYEYWDSERLTGKGLLSMRHAAKFAGLGTLGKNTLLLNRVYGNRLGIGVVLTDLPLQPDPLEAELCIPGCRLCLDHCPRQALDGKTVDQFRCRPHTYGQTDRGYDVTNCNVCRMVCPLTNGVPST